MAKHFFIAFFLLVPLSAVSQVRFEAKVSKETLGVNERLRVDFEMNEDGDNFRPPSFDNFRVVGGPSQSISHQWVNGRRSYQKTFSYFLAPTARGRFTIGQATIEVDGKTYKTSPVTVEVTAAVDTPSDGEGGEAARPSGIHLVADVSKANPYLNEGVTVVYKLYVSHNTTVSGWREMDSPRFSDFWSQNIDNQDANKVYEGEYGGQPHRYVILRRTVLYPQKTGKLEIEPLSLDVSVEVPTNRKDIFGRRLTTRQNVTVSAGRRTIDVKPLPEAGKPADFTGAVGDFNFSVRSDKSKLDAGESLNLNVEVSGNGNLKLLSLPQPVAPGNFEVYEPERQDKVTTGLGGMRGSIAHNYVVVPQNQGIYSIKPLRFSYFDLRTETYKTLQSRGITVEVEVENGPVASAGRGISSGDGNYRQPVTLSEGQFKYIKRVPRLTAIDSRPFFGSTLFWSLVAGPFLMIPLVLFLAGKRRAYQSDAVGMQRRRTNRLARKYLSEAKRTRRDHKLFYESLDRALHNYLKAKLSIETSDFTKEKIASLLQNRGLDQDINNRFIRLLSNCELARYTPQSRSGIEEDYREATEVIAAMDRQVG